MPIHEGFITDIEAAIAHGVAVLTCEMGMGAVRVHARVILYPDWEELIGLLNAAFDQKRALTITYDVHEGRNRLLSVWAPGSPIQGAKYIVVRNLTEEAGGVPFPADAPELPLHAAPARTLTWKQKILGYLRHGG